MKGSEQQNQSQVLKMLSIEALQLFIKGNQKELEQKLKLIQQTHNLINNLNQGHSESPRKEGRSKNNKFKYDLNFQQEEQDNQNLKKRKQPKPMVKSLRKFEYCSLCPDNQQLHLLSASNFVFLALPKLKTFRKCHHLIIAPVDHIQTRIGADEGITQQIKNYQKCLIQMFDKMGQHAIFIEQFCSNNQHIYLQCIGIPLKKAYDLPFFFRQALENAQGFWTTHKKIIQIRKQKGGIEKQIPKQIKYFYIDFGLGYGYAHVIEDEKYWDKKFCYEVVAASLGLESYEVKSTQQYSQSELQIKAKEFDKLWKPFDWTVLINSEN